jgi:hypothetical protein
MTNSHHPVILIQKVEGSWDLVFLISLEECIAPPVKIPMGRTKTSALTGCFGTNYRSNLTTWSELLSQPNLSVLQM